MTEDRAGPGWSRILPVVLAVEAAVLLALVVTALAGCMERGVALELNRSLAAQLSLTDLALWSEASYCRHPSQADLFAAYSDHPAALEHFPAGSLVPPPPWGRLSLGVVRGGPADGP